jgi:hypothetical protein
MAEQFNEEDRAELLERGFNNEQLEYLESLEIDPEDLFSDICKVMDDFGDTPEQIIESYEEANNNPPNTPTAPAEGGKRRRNKKGKKSRSRKSKKGRRTKKNMRTKKSRRTRKGRR